jgi:hypothetical protein
MNLNLLVDIASRPCPTIWNLSGGLRTGHPHVHQATDKTHIAETYFGENIY